MRTQLGLQHLQNELSCYYALKNRQPKRTFTFANDKVITGLTYVTHLLYLEYYTVINLFRVRIAIVELFQLPKLNYIQQLVIAYSESQKCIIEAPGL